MKLFIALVCFLVSVAAFQLNETEITSTPTFTSYKERIYNGTTARVGQFPYQVGLLLTPDGKVFNWCGGSLISEKWVLTAAHCIYSAYVAYTYLGATTSKNAEVYYTVFSNDFIIHRGYMGHGHLNDIALIKIPKTRLSKKIQIVRLPAMSMLYESFLHKYAIISGWGQTSSHSNATADSLQWARLQIMENNDCSHYYDDITDSDLCVSTNGSSTTCQGDSGGPLVLESKRILVGLSSFSSLKGCQTGYPAGFTRVSNYLCWIKYHTGVVY